MPALQPQAASQPTIPDAATLEHALRAAVRDVYRAGNLEELTVRRIRRVVELELGLEEGFFKSEPEAEVEQEQQEGKAKGKGEGWKERSKRIISGEVDACAGDDASSRPASAKPTPKKGRKMKEKLLPVKKMGEGVEVGKGKGRKRKGADEGKTKKRRKKESDTEHEENGSGFEVEGEEEGEEESSSPRGKKHRATSTLSPPPKEIEAEADRDVPPPAVSTTNGVATEGSESEMSVLIDEPPKKRGRPKAKAADATKQEKKTKPAPKKKQQQQQHQRKPSATAAEPADPDQEEIKRLQGWLLKCGIRKLWWKELQPYETSKAKIRHLKEMLAEAGMSGRYSLEKASQIREERELKADLEAVQEGARIWGKGEDEDDDGGGGGGGDSGGGRSKRQVAKGLQGLDFLNDEDGEETD